MKTAIKIAIQDGEVRCPRWARRQTPGECYGCDRFLAKSERVIACGEEVPTVTALSKLQAKARASQ